MAKGRNTRRKNRKTRRGGAFAADAADYSPSYAGYEADVLQPGQAPLTSGIIADAGSGMIGGRRRRRRKSRRRR